MMNPMHLTKKELYEEYVVLRKKYAQMSDRLDQQHQEHLPPEIQERLQTLYATNHRLTVETRHLKAENADLKRELKAAHDELQEKVWVR